MSEIEETDNTQEELSELRAQVVRLKAESAGYRVARNQALREAHAYKELAQAHKADTEQVSEEALSNLKITNGKVEGEFTYNAPSLASQVTTPAPETNVTPASVAMSMETIATMSTAEINQNWEQVSQIMANQTR